jgi:hypothetical protein
MEKKRLIVNMANLPDGVLEAIQRKYPNGYADYVIKVPKGLNDFFYAITVDTESASYLVKVNVKVDAVVENDEKDQVDDEIEINADDESLAENPEDIDDLDD